MSENRFYTGKVAFVTGGGSGIGRATALAFAREGARVTVADISEDGAAETAHLIEEQGGSAVSVKCDVTRTEDLRAALDKTIEAFGRLDIAFNNAGVEQRNATIADFEEDEWDRIHNVNLRPLYGCVQMLLLSSWGTLSWSTVDKRCHDYSRIKGVLLNE